MVLYFGAAASRLHRYQKADEDRLPVLCSDRWPAHADVQAHSYWSIRHEKGCRQATTLMCKTHCLCRLKDLNERCPAELKTFYECMDYYR
jgi:hypothetical protein